MRVERRIRFGRTSVPHVSTGPGVAGFTPWRRAGGEWVRFTRPAADAFWAIASDGGVPRVTEFELDHRGAVSRMTILAVR